MKKSLLLISIVLFYFQITIAQNASDVLENGISVKPGEKIFLQYDNKVLKFDAAKSLQDVANPPDFTTLKDSIIFLVYKNGVNVYLRPLNPLNYSYTTETTEITDPINEAASEALGSIIDVLSMTVNKTTLTSAPKEVTTSTQVPPKPVFDTCPNFNRIEINLKSIQNLLKKNQKEEIIDVFKSLKELSFTDETSTISDLEKIMKSKTPIEKYFATIDSLIDITKKKIDEYGCDETTDFIVKYSFNSIIKDLSTTFEEQKKRLEKLQTAIKLVKDAQINASTGGGEIGLKWCIKLNEVPCKEGKISVYTIAIREAGYKLSDKDEIINFKTEDVFKKTLRIRKYQRFVPEVSVGTAYTSFKYNSYGTTSDSTGQQHVATPTENLVHNLNITTMINWNYYIPNSNIHPLYQIGIGINSGIPTILTGIGIRSNINGFRRLAISGGIAMTWTKELDKLKVGDNISGTDDIDKDLKYQFSWPPKPYIGFQYNF